MSAYLIEGTFEKQDDGEWRIVQAKHRSLSPTELFYRRIPSLATGRGAG